jgi:hypothetical protein
MGTEGLLTGLQSVTCQIAGGGKRDRTADLLHAMQALSQLSYTPGKMNANYTEPSCCSQCKAARRHYALLASVWKVFQLLIHAL